MKYRFSTREEFEKCIRNSCPNKKCKGYHGGDGSLACYYLCNLRGISLTELKNAYDFLKRY